MTVNQNDVLRITAEMSEGVDSLQNVYHFQYVTAATQTDAQVLLDAAVIMETLYSLLVSQMSNLVTFDQVRVQNITQSILLGSTAWPTLTVGGDATAALPLPDAALITYPTAVPKTRGGAYYGGFTEAANVQKGNIVAGLITSLLAVAARALLQQTIAGRLYDYVVINRALGTVIPVVSSIVPAVMRTQRRRRQGVGS